MLLGLRRGASLGSPCMEEEEEEDDEHEMSFFPFLASCSFLFFFLVAATQCCCFELVASLIGTFKGKTIYGICSTVVAAAAVSLNQVLTLSVFSLQTARLGKVQSN